MSNGILNKNRFVQDNKPDLIQLKFKNREAPRSPDPNNPPDNPSIYFIKTPSPKLKTKSSLKKSISAPSNLKTIPENIMLQQPLNPTQPQPQPPMPPRVLQKRKDSVKIKQVPTVSKSNKIKKSKTENDLAYRTKCKSKANRTETSHSTFFTPFYLHSLMPQTKLKYFILSILLYHFHIAPLQKL